MKPSIDELKEYLFSHLISLLQTNSGKNPPEIWIRKDNETIVRTFTEDDDAVGGISAPFGAHHEGGVFRPHENEVVDFIMGFGLTKADAEEVINRVGKKP